MEENFDSEYSFLSHEFMNLAGFPFRDGFLIPGFIDNQNEAVIIGAISQSGNFTEQRHLATILGISRPAITLITGEMINKGLIKQTVNPNDRRGFILSLTDLGKKIALWMVARKELYNKIQLKGFTEKEIRLYNEYTTRMAENLLDISERELTRMPKFDEAEVNVRKGVPKFISNEDQDLFVSMAKRVRKVNSLKDSVD